jgi:hypothetical protein
LRKGLASLRLLGGTNQEDQAAGGGYQGGSGEEDGGKVFDGAEGDYVEGARDGFGAGVLYIDVRQCKGAGHLAEEGGFFVAGLDQGEGEVRGPEFNGEAGETGAGAYVGEGTGEFKIFNHPSCVRAGSGHGGHRGRHGEQVAGGEEALTEVAGDDVFGVADGGEVDAGVPAD